MGRKRDHIDLQRQWQEKQYTPWEYGGTPPPGMLYGNERRLAIYYGTGGAVCLVFAAAGFAGTEKWPMLFFAVPGLVFFWVCARYVRKFRSRKRSRRLSHERRHRKRR